MIGNTKYGQYILSTYRGSKITRENNFGVGKKKRNKFLSSLKLYHYFQIVLLKI